MSIDIFNDFLTNSFTRNSTVSLDSNTRQMVVSKTTGSNVAQTAGHYVDYDFTDIDSVEISFSNISYNKSDPNMLPTVIISDNLDMFNRYYFFQDETIHEYKFPTWDGNLTNAYNQIDNLNILTIDTSQFNGVFRFYIGVSSYASGASTTSFNINYINVVSSKIKNIYLGGPVSTAYSIIFNQNGYYPVQNAGTFFTNSTWLYTDKVNVVNNSFILDNNSQNNITHVTWFDSNDNFIGWTGIYTGTNETAINTNLSTDTSFLPINGFKFALNALPIASSTQTPVNISFNDFQTVSILYDTPSAIDNIYYGAPSVQTGLQFIDSNSIGNANGIDSNLIGNQFSISSTFEFPNTTSFANILNQSAASGSRNFQLFINNGVLAVVVGNNGNWSIVQTSALTLNANQKYDLTITSGGSDVKLYIDGNLEATYSGTTNLVSLSQDIIMGDGPITIYDTQLWTKELSQSEVNQYIQTKPIGNETNLVHYYPIDEGTGTILNDNVSNLDFTLTNPTWESETLYPTIDRVYAGGTLVFGDPVPFAIFKDTSGSPGADFPINDLDGNIMADETKGIAYYGTVSHIDLYTADGLSSEVGITSGTGSSDVNINDQDVWHKYYWNGGIHFWRKPIRTNISWNNIATKGAAYGTGSTTSRKGHSKTSTIQNAEVSKNGVTYIVRLMEGANVEPAEFEGADLHNSEFSLILMNLHAATNSGLYSGSPTDGVTYDNWTFTNNFTNNDFVGWKTNFSDEDFSVDGNGSFKWMQENSQNNLDRIIQRGFLNLSQTDQNSFQNTSNIYGFSPVLTVKHSSFSTYGKTGGFNQSEPDW